MVFSSLIFIFLFFPIALLVIFFSRHILKSEPAVFFSIISLSIGFYYWGSGRLIFIILFCVAFNWALANFLDLEKNNIRKKFILTFGILVNLGILGYFKYSKFILENVSRLIGGSNVQINQLVLPVGISFFTFMAISYLVDVYGNKFKPATLKSYATYMLFFPHIVAGPIVRYDEISANLKSLNPLNIINFLGGMQLFVYGLAMKVLIADNLANVADEIFNLDAKSLTFSEAWLGAITYTFQIYFDFAGYSTMAIGLAKIFGFEFPENFNQPYRARSFTEFWRRWHISLSKFLRDYVYIPLGGSRFAKFRTYLNLGVVFLICGFWHGAEWTFILWGIYQGLFLIVERVLKNDFNCSFDNVLWGFITFILIAIGWVFFRSTSIDHILWYLRAMFSFGEGFQFQLVSLTPYISIEFMLAFFGAIIFSYFPVERYPNLSACAIISDNASIRLAGLFLMISLLIISCLYLISTTYKPFIYFRF